MIYKHSITVISISLLVRGLNLSFDKRSLSKFDYIMRGLAAQPVEKIIPIEIIVERLYNAGCDLLNIHEHESTDIFRGRS